MAEPLINTPVGAPKAPTDISRLRNVSGTRSAAARPAASPFTTTPPPGTTASSVAPDVLLAAHQARDTNRPPAFDARFANASTTYRQGTENKNKSPSQGNDGGAEILAFDPNNAPMRSQKKTAPAQSMFEIIDQVNAPFAQSRSQNVPNDTLPPDPASPRPRQDFARANQAYVHAGAADGLTYGATGFDTSTLLFDHTTFNVVV